MLTERLLARLGRLARTILRVKGTSEHFGRVRDVVLSEVGAQASIKKRRTDEREIFESRVEMSVTVGCFILELTIDASARTLHVGETFGSRRRTLPFGLRSKVRSKSQEES